MNDVYCTETKVTLTPPVDFLHWRLHNVKDLDSNGHQL